MAKYFRNILAVSQRFQPMNFKKYFSSKAEATKYPRELKIPNCQPLFLDKLRPSHRNDLVHLLEEYYYPQDPMGIAMGFPELHKRRDPDFLRDVHQICEEMADGSINSDECISISIVDSAGKLVASILGEVRRVKLGEKKLDVKHSSGNDVAYSSPYLKDVTRMMNKINEGVDFFPYLTPKRAEIVRKRNPPEILLAEPATAVTRPELRKHGLGGILTKACFDQCNSTGCDLILTYPITKFAYRESMQLGFKVVRKMDWPYGGLLPGHSVTWYLVVLPL